jgi:hypothetical protein
MYRAFNLYRLIGTCFVTLVLVFGVGMAIAQTTAPSGNSRADLDRIYQQIVSIRDTDQEVPAELYEQYYAVLKIVDPANAGREHPGHLDQVGMDGCPGTLWEQPPVGQVTNFHDDGETTRLRDDCTYPRCRQSRDVMFRLVVNHPEYLRFSTCGSNFDTYLCIYKDVCCADTALHKVFAKVQDNDGVVCGSNIFPAVLDTCLLDTGTYYITLDGSGSGTSGLYVFDIIGLPDEPCPPLECTEGYYEHIEADHPSDEVCENSVTVNCGDGYCGTIDRLGDRDVYHFTLTSECTVVTLSAFANDTPGRSGYNGGLNPKMRLFAGPACDHPIYENDDVEGSPPNIFGNDSRIVTMIGLRPGTYWVELTGNASIGKYEFLINCMGCP